MKSFSSCILMFAVMFAGCQSTEPGATGDGGGVPSRRPASASPTDPARPLAFVDGRPIDLNTIADALLEQAGGQIFAEAVLDQSLAVRLQQNNLTVTPELIQTERDILARLLSDDSNQAQRLIDQQRARLGLGEQRFAQLLHRSAAMRLLVHDQVEVSDVAVRQAFEIDHGPRFEIRLIVCDELVSASNLFRRAQAGESFVDLAIAHSTDLSSAQGGLLDPISPQDATYPTVLRDVLASMNEGDVSRPIVLERGFGLAQLIRKMPADQIDFESVREDYNWRIRRRVEDLRMRELRRGLLDQADIVIMNKTLKDSWRRWHQQRQSN